MTELKKLMMRRPKYTLAVAESMTTGWLQARIGAIPGASDFFRGGITAYNLDQKVKHLHVGRAKAKKVNCVSAEVAEQMAQGACALFGTNLGVSTTGYAQTVVELKISEPFAWWAVAWRKGRGRFHLSSGRIVCPGATRVEAQERVADAAFAALLDVLKTELRR